MPLIDRPGHLCADRCLQAAEADIEVRRCETLSRDWNVGLPCAGHDDPAQAQFAIHLSLSRQLAGASTKWILGLGSSDSPAPTTGRTLCRTKATLSYRRTKNLRAVQLLLGHTKLESTIRYLGIEVNDALEMAEQTEV
jgi:integrase